MNTGLTGEQIKNTFWIKETNCKKVGSMLEIFKRNSEVMDSDTKDVKIAEG